MTAAFQPNAFQNNAFQSDSGDTHDGGSDSWFGYHRKKKLKQEAALLKRKYNEIVKQLPTAPIASAVDSYIKPENKEEWERRQQAKPIFKAAPPASRIDFQAIASNAIAQNRFNRAIASIKDKMADIIRQNQDEEEMLILMLMMEI